MKDKYKRDRKICEIIGVIFFLIGGLLTLLNYRFDSIFYTVSILALIKTVYWDLKQLIKDNPK